MHPCVIKLYFEKERINPSGMQALGFKELQGKCEDVSGNKPFL